MGAKERRKGAVGEREAAAVIASIFGIDASRSARNGVDRAEDIHHGVAGLFAEVKRVERLNVPQALEKADQDAGGKVPTLWHRRNRGKWMLTLYAEDIESFCAILEAHRRSGK